jgi:hypothetical protein
MQPIETDIIDRVDGGLLRTPDPGCGSGNGISSMTSEREVLTAIFVFCVPESSRYDHDQLGRFDKASKGWTYWMATRPSTLPIAYPFPVGKQVIVLVCIFKGDSFDWSNEVWRFHFISSADGTRLTIRALTLLTTPGLLRSTIETFRSAVPKTYYIVPSR